MAKDSRLRVQGLRHEDGRPEPKGNACPQPTGSNRTIGRPSRTRGHSGAPRRLLQSESWEGKPILQGRGTMVNIECATDQQPVMLRLPVAELDAIKARQRATWASGDFGIIGTTLQIVGESLCEAVDLRSGARVLDVAAGNGNASLAAARRWAQVTSTDYVPELLENGKRRAEGERLAIEFQEADAEALPFPDGSFDVVLSTFGVMFAPNHVRAASELLRVCRTNGRIGLTNWTPEGFLGDFFRTMGTHVPPPAGVRSPMLWGDMHHLRSLFGDGV